MRGCKVPTDVLEDNLIKILKAQGFNLSVNKITTDEGHTKEEEDPESVQRNGSIDWSQRDENSVGISECLEQSQIGDVKSLLGLEDHVDDKRCTCEVESQEEGCLGDGLDRALRNRLQSI